MKKKLICYGTPQYENSIKSLVKSCENFFTDFNIFGPKDIDGKFYTENVKILSQNRGAGYWLWKPYFIKKVLGNSNDGDIIFYVDAGNIFLHDPSFLYEKLDYNQDMIFFDNRDGMNDGNPPPNKNWTKKDAFVIMGLDLETHTNSPHVNASYQIYRKSQNTVSFVDELLFWSKNENIITDAPNLHGNNYSTFVDHRHDQSILSLMCSKNNLNLEIDPSEWGNKCGLRKFPQIFKHHRNPYFTL